MEAELRKMLTKDNELLVGPYRGSQVRLQTRERIFKFFPLPFRAVGPSGWSSGEQKNERSFWEPRCIPTLLPKYQRHIARIWSGDLPVRFQSDPVRTFKTGTRPD